MMNRVTEKDIQDIAEKHKFEPAAIQAVYEIESNGSGFSLIEGIQKPKILFEGHVFWNELKKVGIDPAKKVKGNENVVYEKWTRKHYQSTRLLRSQRRYSDMRNTPSGQLLRLLLFYG